MSLNRKYAGLPDLDLAPDVYETPDLADDVSTIQSTTHPSSPTPSDPDIDAARLNTDTARSRFQPSRVDARNVNFSDTIGSERRSYLTSTNRSRRRAGFDDGESEDEEEEGPRERLARLLREAEELKGELAREETESKKEGEQSHEEGMVDSDAITELSRTLQNLQATIRGSTRASAATTAETALAQKLATQPVTSSDSAQKDAAPTTQSATSIPSTLLLESAASFDQRLAQLEAALGLSSTNLDFNLASTSSSIPTEPPLLTPILPTLTKLNAQMSTLTSTLTPTTHTSEDHPTQQTHATNPTLESLSSRLRTLSNQAQHSLPHQSDQNLQDDQDPSHLQTLQALHSLLPTITNLTPLLPPLLTRLHSLRSLHASASTAAEDISELEKGQDEVNREIERWKMALEKVEGGVRESEAVMKGNVEVLGGWVRALEGRVGEL